jgi:hypothetical protein
MLFSIGFLFIRSLTAGSVEVIIFTALFSIPIFVIVSNFEYPKTFLILLAWKECFVAERVKCNVSFNGYPISESSNFNVDCLEGQIMNPYIKRGIMYKPIRFIFSMILKLNLPTHRVYLFLPYAVKMTAD